VPAAGQGSRFDASIPKQYTPLLGRPVLSWTLEALLADPGIAGVVVVLAEDDPRWQSVAESRDPRVRTCAGGTHREDSVARGLLALERVADPTDWVLVHDAARPCLRHDDLTALFETLLDDPVGGLLATPVSDTLKRADGDERACETVPRQALWRALTPQMFRLGVLARALALCRDRGRTVTDEAAAIECLGLKPKLVRGHADNVKITHPEDATLAEAILRGRQR
jgi:2-C-methyl-D-erythritol 4-phosphate cytidylyltransferase